MDQHSETATQIRISRIVEHSRMEGPDLRFVIWVQGCSIRCTGCFNRSMWSFSAGKAIAVPKLVEHIRSANVEGITLLGGEPFDQAGPVGDLAAAVQALRLGVVTFTGYQYEHLVAQAKPDVLHLLHHTDLLVDGPFLSDRKCTHLPWIGSDNQRYIHISGRYRRFDFASQPNGLEWRIDLNTSRIRLNGLEDEAVLSRIRNRLFEKGILTSKRRL